MTPEEAGDMAGKMFQGGSTESFDEWHDALLDMDLEAARDAYDRAVFGQPPFNLEAAKAAVTTFTELRKSATTQTELAAACFAAANAYRNAQDEKHPR